LLNWLKNIRAKIRDLNTTVNTYKDETENQTLPIIAHINRAKKFMDKSLFLEARDILTEALAISDKDSLVYRYLGMCEEQLGNLKSAIEMYQKSTQINPQDKTSWHKLGMLQVSIKDYESAENSFENASKINPTNTDIQTGWGMSLLKQKKYNQALEKFTKAIQINRYNFSAMLLAAITEIRLGNYNDAEPKLIFLMKTNPTEGAAYEYANMCTLKENFDDAIKYAKKSVELNPNMLPAYMLLGDVYSLKFDYVNSTKYFTEAENRELTNAMLYTAWGNALLNLYKFEEAKVGEMLAFTGAVNDDVIDTVYLAGRLLEYLKEDYLPDVCTRYKLNIDDVKDLKGFELLEKIGRKRGMLISGGEIDTERAANTVLDEFRGGKIGKITLEHI